MKILLLFGLSFWISANAQKNGQSDSFSLLDKLKNLKSDTNKINTLNRLSENFFEISKLDSSLVFANQAISLSQTLNWDKGLSEGNYNIANALLIKYEFNQAKIYFENSLKSAYKINNCNIIGNNLIGIANVFSGLKDYNNAEKYFNLALNKFKECNNSSGECSVYQNIALFFQKQGMNDSALKYFQKIIKIAEKNNDQLSISKSYGYMGNIHILKSNFAEALAYFQKSLKINEDAKNKNGLITDYSNLGVFYLNLYTMPEALKYFKKALNLAKELGDVQKIGKILCNKGIATEKSSGSYDAKGRESKLLEAKKLYEKSLEIANNLNDKILIGTSFERLGNINFWLNNNEQAILHFENAFKLFDEIGSKFEIASITGKLGVMYFVIAKDSSKKLNKKDRKNFVKKGFELLKNAIDQNTKYEYFDQLRTNYSNITNMYYEIGDSVNAFRAESGLNQITFKMFQLNKLIEFTKIEKEYELKLQQNIYENEKRIEEIKQKNHERNLIVIALAVVFLIGILVLYFWKMWKNNVALESKNKIITDTNLELDYLNSELSIKNEEIEISNKSLLESNATKDKFFSIIAHDLKNPLTALISGSDLLLNHYHKFDDEKRLKHIKKLYTSSNFLFKILENLLLWARSQTDNVDFSPNIDSLNSVIKENYELLKLNLHEKQINFFFNYESEIKANFDRNMLNTVIRNLFSNAIKFTPEGGTIEVGIIDEPSEVSKPSEGYIYVYVKDTGVGIRKSNLENLFRIDATITTMGTNNEKGTGLGLILCKEFVEKHNGKIWIESEVGNGSTFWFSIPKASEFL